MFGFECSLDKEPTDDMKKETTGADDEPKDQSIFKYLLVINHSGLPVSY